MPLPDERPRQSVANLIGRFEQQTKRQSLTNVPALPGGSRFGSVSGHLAGDSAKEDGTQRSLKEWPPRLKPAKEAGVVDGVPATSEGASVDKAEPAKLSLPTPDASPKPEVKELQGVSSPGTAAAAALTTEQSELDDKEAAGTDNEEPVVEGVASDPAPPEEPAEASVSTPATHESTTTRPARINAASAKPKSTSTTAPRASVPAKGAPSRAAATTKSPYSSTHSASSISASAPVAPTALRAKSTTSSTQAQTKPRPSTSASTRPPPATPSRAKTPSATVPRMPASSVRPKTPASFIRPKTPMSTARPHTPASSARPKTPASGLFAPTAASLARARNALDAPPLPVKRKTLSPDASERLSKPTAASISKARVPTAAASTPPRATPAKQSAAAARGTTSARNSALKTKVAPADSKADDKATATKSADEAAAVSSESGSHVEIDVGSNAHNITAEDHGEHVEITAEPVVDEHVVAQGHEEPENSEHLHNVPVELSDVAAHEESRVQETAEEEAEVQADEASISDAVGDEQSASPTPVNHTSGGDDLEDLITMLEGKSTVRLSISSDVAGEIPDEE